MSFTLYGGYIQPKVILLSESGSGSIADIIDLTFLNDDDLTLGCNRNENPDKIIKTKILVDGKVHEKFGGFRFRGSYSWDVLMEDHRDTIASILNHPYHIQWYPHGDDLTISFNCIVTGGDTYNLVKVNGSDRSFHRGNINLIGVDVLPYIPANLDYTAVTSDDLWSAFSGPEKEASLAVCSDDAWSSFDTDEKRRCRIVG